MAFNLTRVLRHTGAAALLLFSSATTGAAGPAPGMTAGTAFDWTGFRTGLVAGHAWDERDAGYSYNNVPAFVLPMLPIGAGLTAKGVFLGGVAGYDQRIGAVVLGAEGDISWMNLRGHGVSLVPGDPLSGFPPITFKTSYQLNWLATLRGRVGIPFDQVLVYGTGGLALGEVSMQTSVEVGNFGVSAGLAGSTRQTKAGWTVGGGAEVAVTNYLTTKAELLYFDLGDVWLNAANPTNPSSLDVGKKVAGVMARVGLAYKF